MKKIRVIQYGLGPIGCSTARTILSRDNLKLVAAVDIDPGKVGKDLGDLLDGKKLGLKVVRSMAEVLTKTKADVVMHTTHSYFDLFKGQILEILKAGLDVVSTSEELSFPWLAHPKEAKAIDAAAKKAGKTVLATGVNPGFLMDSLPLFLTSISERVDRIQISRIQNASLRRGPFQKKIGSGLTKEEFKAAMAQGRMAHVGLVQSVGMIFDTLGKKLVKYEETIDPVLAQKAIKTDFFEVEPGQPCGLNQVARAYDEKGEFLTLTFIAALDSDVDEDRIKISGQPNLNVVLKGIHGDVATRSIAVNAIRRVKDAAPGLVTMRDLPIVTIG
jgi:4-hydroxy-tetrahydrodipicolinate reductase